MSLPTKTCRACDRELPATPEVFGVMKRGLHGVRATCKECRAPYWEARWSRDKEKLTAQTRAWYASHRDEQREYKKAYHAANRETANARSAQYREAHRDECNEATRRWHRDHPGYWLTDESRARNRNRMAARRRAPGTHTAADVAAQYLRQHGRCYWCDERVGKDYHVDHVIPLSKGGSNDPSNLVIACPSCNLSKNAKLPHEFSERLC